MKVETVNRASGAALGLLTVCVIFGALTLLLKLSVQQPSLTATRDAERVKALQEITVTEAATLSSAAWVDQTRGVVRLPINTAIQLAAQQWQNPAAARSELLARQAKASAELPKAPEKPSAFE
jgi:hypothetical protein